VLDWDPEHCSVVPGPPKNELIKLERRDEKGELAEYCWVDPSREDIVVAGEWWGTARRKKTGSYSIDFRRDRTFGWVPSRWSIDFAGTMAQTAQHRGSIVTKYAINEPIPPETFVLKFPSGTELWDRSKREWFIRKDGSKLLVPQGKGRPSYEQLVQEDDTIPASQR
jgi:hypothetical protein